MKASITYMRGPQIPRDVISEETIPVSAHLATSLIAIADHVRGNFRKPKDCTEVRIVIGDTLQ